MIKWMLYFFAIVSLFLSLYWGITQNQTIEPWSAFISAVLFIIGLFFQKKESNGINFQNSFFSLFSKAKIKNPKGDNKQINFFGIGNTQEIEHSINDKDNLQDKDSS